MKDHAKVQDELVSSVVDALALTVEACQAYLPDEIGEHACATLRHAVALIGEQYEAYRIASNMLQLQEQLHKRAIDERDHWKANHDAAVARARVLIDRVDMPLERVSAYHLIHELQAELTDSREREQGAFMRGWAARLCTGSNLDEQA